MSITINRRFLDVSMSVLGVANEPPATPAPQNGTQYIVGSAPAGAFANATAGSVARYDGYTNAWKFTKPALGQMELLNVATKEIVAWDGTAWAVKTQVNSGEDGKSAFELAQDAGFTGTEAEWLASLKGDPPTASEMEVMVQNMPKTVWAYSGNGEGENTRGSINCHSDGMDIKVIGLPYEYDKEQFSIYGARLVHWRHFPNVAENDGWVEHHIWMPYEDTGVQTLRDGFYYRRKNGVVQLDFTLYSLPLTQKGSIYEHNLAEVLPEGFRPPRLDLYAPIITNYAMPGLIAVRVDGTISFNFSMDQGTEWIDGLVQYFV